MSSYENQERESELIVDAMESFIDSLGYEGLTYDIFISSGPKAECELNLEYHNERLFAEIKADTVTSAQLTIVSFCEEVSKNLSYLDDGEYEDLYSYEDDEFNAYFAEKQRRENHVDPCENCLGEDCCCCEYFLEN